jgi:RNA polymerase sigma factor (sigma-70 family)
MDVATLMLAARAGDRAAWDRLVERLTPLLWATARAYRLGEADAADVVQTAWLRLLEHFDSVRDPSAVGAWLATTVRHESLRALRLGARQIPTEAVPEVAAPSTLDAHLLTEERDRVLWRAFATLSPECQGLLRLLASDPAPSYAEVAAALDRPIGSLGPTRRRCLERLRGTLEPSGITAEIGDS